MSAAADPYSLPPLAGALLHTLREAAFAVDAQGQIAAWNPAAERVLGWRAEQICGEAPDRLLAETGQSWSELDATLRRAPGQPVTARLKRAAGDEVTLSLVGLAPESGDAGPLVVVGQRADDGRAGLLAEKEERLAVLRGLLHSLTDGVFLVDQDGVVSVWSTPLETLLGPSAADMLGEGASAALDAIAGCAADPPTIRGELAQALRLLEEEPVVYLTTPAPQQRLLQVRLFHVQGVQDRPLGWGGLVRDLTRTDEINVLTTVAHELRTPLAAIKGYTTTLLDNIGRWDSAATQEFLQTINSSTDRLSRLVENILDLSRLEANRLTLERQPVNLPELAEQAVDEIAQTTPRQRFSVEFPDEFPEIEGDRLRLRQVLANLLQNAVKYAPDATPILVEGSVHDDRVQVRVRDHGTGIPPEDRDRIFERFYQADPSAAAQAAGVGLGLYIARRIAAAHDGRLWMENPPEGPGSVFVLDLPLAPRPSSAEGPAPAPAAIARPADEVLVLLAEDDQRLLRFVRANLEASGYRVLTAPDGESALSVFERELPDLLLLDVELPKLDGYAVCQRVREFSNVPIIMLTGRSEEADIVQSLDLGADDHLTKPFGVQELLARVRAVLRRGQLADEAPTQPTLTIDELQIDFARREVTRAGEKVNLTPTEYKLLYYLAVNAGQILTHTQLLRKVWGPAYETEISYLWVYVSRLRKKLEPDPANPRYLISEAGVGYCLAC